MLPVEKIAKAIRANPAEFANLYLQAQIGLGSRTDYRTIQQQAGASNPMIEALEKAKVGGFLDDLLVYIAESGLEDGTIAAALLRGAAARDPGSPLEAIVNKAKGLAQPDLAVAGYGNALRWTGKISIDDVATGTGVLIAPHLVLTAWHVLAKLFERHQGKWRPLQQPGTAQRISVAFDDVLRYLDDGQRIRSPKPIEVTAHNDWCVAWCECHSDELADRLPSNFAQLEGLWDYLVLRVTPPPGWERRWVSMTSAAVVPRADDRIRVFQHAAGQPMTYDEAQIVGKPKGVVDALGHRRFLHSVNTASGSSGGPCFDRDFRFFGIHQGAWKKGTKKKPGANRGVPLVKVLEDIEKRFPPLPPADPSEIPIWDLGAEQYSAPVVGCGEFQQLVWKAAVGSKPKIILIGGSAGTGKSFHVALLAHMLRDGGHLKVVLDAQKVGSKDALALAADICTAAGSPVPAFRDASEANTTRSAWLKDELAEKTILALDAVRAGRLVWLALKDLNRFEIKGRDASEFLLLLYEQALSKGWLRVILDGMKGDLPTRLLSVTEVFVVRPITEADIHTYLERLLADLKLPPGGPALVVQAKGEFDKYQQTVVAKPDAAIDQLIDSLRRIASDYLLYFGR